MHAYLGTVYSSSVWICGPVLRVEELGFGYFLHINIMPEHEILHLETGFSCCVVAEVRVLSYVSIYLGMT